MRFIYGLMPVLFLGCVDLDTRIQIQPDGSAKITEKFTVSQGLLDLGSQEKGKLAIAELLTKQAVAARLKHMGTNVKLVSHQLKDAAQGGKESISIFEVADINDYRYASPFLAYLDYPENSIIQCKMEPLYKSRNYAGQAGEMCVSFRPIKTPKSEVRERAALPDKVPAPKDVQTLRQLQPVFADLLNGFKIRFTLESYSKIEATGFGWRDRKAGTNSIDIMHISGKDLDQHGVSILENEEIMLDIFQGKVGSLNIASAVKNFSENQTVPLFLPWGSAHAPWRQSDEITFRPSKQLFDKHFAGKQLDFDRWQSTGKNIRSANFAEIGWPPAKPK